MLEGIKGLEKWGQVWKEEEDRKKLQESVLAAALCSALENTLENTKFHYSFTTKFSDANYEPMSICHSFLLW